MTIDKDFDAKRSLAAINRVRSMVSGPRLAAADRIAKIYNEYVPLERDEGLQKALLGSVASVTTPITGKPDKRRIVAVVGRSGAGKTTALAKHISTIDAMKAYVDEDGVQVTPVLSIEAPSPCTPRLLAVAGLEALGHAPRDRIRENEAWLLFRRLLKVHKVMWVVIDEAQNAIESASVREATIIGDAFKSLTQMPDWPVRLILAGVPPLASFLARKQLYNRRTVVPFDTLDANGNNDLIRQVVTTVVVTHAGLKLDIDFDDIRNSDDDDRTYFLERLMHACDAEFGSVVQLVRAAVELAILGNEEAVNIGHFKETYASFSGCRPSKNIFTAVNWQELEPATALLREEDRAWEREQMVRKGKRVTKFGVRPQ
ncbi:ATP-binding protein [Rhizobium binae]|uniref:ATP-binding protein n=1 Tax=Rhizobium binae TaxID=1138190 RepID=UPI001C828EF4|nr:ATP-binding protein [Rhizobium binae]MBX4963675.1 AAA family ATPase [Rhizobium binae]